APVKVVPLALKLTVLAFKLSDGCRNLRRYLHSGHHGQLLSFSASAVSLVVQTVLRNCTVAPVSAWDLRVPRFTRRRPSGRHRATVTASWSCSEGSARM